MPNVHPFFTHFPIALFTVALVFDLMGILLKKDYFERVGWWSHVCGTIGLASTVISGLLAKNHVVVPPAGQSLFEMHEQIAFLVSALATVLLLWRISVRSAIPSNMKAVYLGLVAVLVILVWVGAWHGGELVYTFGVGVGGSP